MVSSNLGSVDLTDGSTGHTNGTHGHDVLNDWIDIATRPGSTRPVTHSSAGVLTIDVNAVAGGHVILVTVGANITGLTLNNVTDGLPFMIVFLGNGSSSFTIDMSGLKLNSSTTLNSAVAIGPTDALAVSLLKLPSGDFWAPGGLMVFNSTAGISGISAQANGSLLHTGSSLNNHLIPLPSGIIAGDFLEIVVQTQENSDPGAPNTPSGWTQRFTNTPSFGFIPRITKFYKYASGSEGGTNVTVNWTTATRVCGGSQVWRGVHASTPYDTTASAAVMGNGNPNPPTRTSVTNGAMHVVYAAGNKTGGLTCTAPGGYTKSLDQSSSDRSVVIARKLMATAGADDPAAFAWAVENDTVFTDVLKPA